ncbi:porin [Paraferrimonas haliotis]|uniref:Porin n=1 Tax=Paraferrimonas haliotis TaxID=2013866 RepID=A0AA37TMI0_9GAMM|nr:porin [Paraferrimonas haliotis]GLS82403.1 porin [Paraferrimonas haliotis]
MKKTLISASVASILAATSFSSMAQDPTFYGRLDVSVANSSNGYGTMSSNDNGQGGTVLENNASMIGVKGAQNIADNLDIVYKVEVGANGFNNSNPFSARATWIGLKTAAGTAIIGREDSVFKASEGKVDAFGNGNSDIDKLLPGQGRESDVINYYSPKIADLVSVNASYVLTDSLGGGKYAESDNAYAANITFGDKGMKAQPFYAAAAYVDGIEDVKAYRGVVTGKLAGATLGFLYQNSESVKSDVDLKGNTYIASATYPVGNFLLKAQYGQDDSGLGKFATAFGDGNLDASGDKMYDMQKDIEDFDLKYFAIGANYNLASNAYVYAYYTKFDGDFSLKLSNPTTPATNTVDMKDDMFTLGIRYTF